MNSIRNDILRMYDNLEMSLEDITRETGARREVVELILREGSSKYAEEARRKRGVLSDSVLDEVTNVIMSIARGGENDGIRLKAAMYLRNDALGREDAAVETRRRLGAGSGNNARINVFLLNAELQKRDAKRARAKEGDSIPVASSCEILELASA